MANIELIVPKLIRWEGKAYTNDPIDPGGATKLGVTLRTWQKYGHDMDHDHDIDEDDVKLLTESEFQTILKVGYWDLWQADYIHSQSVAEILVDWVWMSGQPGITIPQRLLGLKEDGQVGKVTLTAVNNQEPTFFHSLIILARKKFYQDIIAASVARYEKKIGRKSTPAERVKNTAKRFEKGWLNRLNDYKFIS